LKSKIIFVLSLILCSCNSKSEKLSTDRDKEETKLNSNKENHKVSNQRVDSLVTLGDDLIDIQEINPDILVDLKYATLDNFMKEKMYSRMNRAFLQKEVALRLSNCQDYI
jgi:D-alanyl-D-alanine dipeptidase